MRHCAPFLLLVFTFFFASLSLAIFADEAYRTDYHHPLLGHPEAHNTFFHRPSAASKASLLYTLSERLVLGAINPKNGSVIWRQQLQDQACNLTAPRFLKAAEGGSTVVSAASGKVQAWDATDGRLAWEWGYSDRINGLEITAVANGERDVLVLSEHGGSSSVVRRLAAETGKIRWESTDLGGDVSLTLVASSESVFYLSLRPILLKGFRIKITELNMSNGKQIGQPILLGSENEITSKDLILHFSASSGIPILVWTDKQLKTLTIFAGDAKKVTGVSVTPSNGDFAQKIIVHAPRSYNAHPHILVHYQAATSHWAEVYHVGLNAATAKKLYDLPRLDGQGAFSTSSHGPDVYFIRHTSFKNILLSSADSPVLSRWDVPLKDHGGIVDPQEVIHAVSEIIPRESSKYAVRSALAWRSGDWELIQNGDSFWVRPEGLAGTIAATFVEITHEEKLADELVAEGHSSIIGAYVHRVKRHAKDLQYILAWTQAMPDRLSRSFFGDKSRIQDKGFNRNNFGFLKFVIVATENGRIAALDTSNQGKVVWSTQAIKLSKGEKWNVTSIEVEEGNVLIRATAGGLLRVDPYTGTVLQYQPSMMVSTLRTSISVFDELEEKIFIPIRDDGSLGELPGTSLGHGIIIVTSGGDGIVKGWSEIEDHKPALVWQFLPAVGERVQSVTARPSHDPVASIGKALGDRNVLYKYLNPNTLLVTAIHAKASAATFYIIDATSGAIIHSITHPGVDTTQPIISTISEYWFTYSLYSETPTITQGSQVDQRKISAHQLVISELYESLYPNDRGPLRSNANFSSVNPTTTGEGDLVHLPHAISQTYLIPGPISIMSVASTLQGITPRSLLCVLPELNALISIPRAVIDPRRPVGRDATAAEIEEGLFRYSPLLDFEAKWILNHKRDLMSLSRVVTSPSWLESTSLVFAYGEFDLFGTRSSPIGGFDILGKGFSKIQLMATVIALALGTFLLAPFVRRKQINDSYKP